MDCFTLPFGAGALSSARACAGRTDAAAAASPPSAAVSSRERRVMGCLADDALREPDVSSMAGVLSSGRSPVAEGIHDSPGPGGGTRTPGDAAGRTPPPVRVFLLVA